MNKIYSLKYSHITGGLIAVSELSGRVSSRATSKKKHKRILALCFLGLLPSSYSFASQMDISNFYIRDYMDFAQNKGIFQAGATNIEIVKKDGSTLKLPEVPFPDFSPVANKGSTTSIGGAYSITATHNTKNHHSVATQNWGTARTSKQTGILHILILQYPDLTSLLLRPEVRLKAQIFRYQNSRHLNVTGLIIKEKRNLSHSEPALVWYPLKKMDA